MVLCCRRVYDWFRGDDMIFSEKMQMLRRSRGFTQEALADKLSVSRQAVAKWEAGQAFPDISNLIALSNLLNVTVDYLVREQHCELSPAPASGADLEQLIAFRLEANVNTYAAFMNETQSTRPGSHDYSYSNGDYTYHDTYVGGEQFAGQEAIWYQGKVRYAMNYLGRVLGQHFSGNFLKEALRHATPGRPYRGPEFYQSGEYTYKSSVAGDFTWFQGFEEIYCDDEKQYECYFHGGLMR